MTKLTELAEEIETQLALSSIRQGPIQITFHGEDQVRSVLTALRQSERAGERKLREALWNITSGVDDHLKHKKLDCGSCRENVRAARALLDKSAEGA